MSVLLETSLGDIVLDLHAEDCPNTCRNFLKLCKAKRYNGCLFFDVQRDFLVQTGDPTNRGTGGDSIYGVLYGPQARFFEHEIRLPRLNHSKKGTVGMASAGEHLNASQFYITTGTSLNRLDGQHTVFGEVAEGMDTVERINESLCDENGRPWQNIRIKHTFVLDDPFPDPPGMEDVIPDKSPVWKPDLDEDRLEEDWRPEDEGKDPEDLERRIREQEAKSRAVVLEMIGDLPSADAIPPENVLFVCKLNPVTSDEDLEIIFSRFGKILSCDVIRDKKTGESLCYAFIAYDNSKSAEDAYFKMNNVLIDDRRIHVDFSQSVSHLWKQHSRQAAGINPGHGKVSQSGNGGTTRGKLDMRGNPLESRSQMSGHKILLDPDKVKESQAWGRSKSGLSHSKSREYEVGFPKTRRERPSSSSHEDRRDRYSRDEWRRRHDDPYEKGSGSYSHNKSRSQSRRETHHTVRHDRHHRSRSRERYRDAPRYKR